MTLDDLERLTRNFSQKMRFTEPSGKMWMKIDLHISDVKM